ncbi:MAG: symmetrical bis(5'-nucleosyl)-tetraphosphatase [Gammaproteobacteria bacterium]|jgi:bis(5'-nucleosyl)-tetraphosphatase (symmetrical)
MAVYAIGDVQGCFDELQALLDMVNFKPGRDQLWFVGDLVNRGPKSLEALRFAHSVDAITVLGNHDLHLLASAFIPKHRKNRDKLQDVIDAPDAGKLLTWLRRQPLLHHDSELGYTMIHAGLPPQWDLARARSCAAQVEKVLRGENYHDFFRNMYGDKPNVWKSGLSGMDRLRFITNCFTRLRYCDRDGRLALDEKGPPGSQPKRLKPWFEWKDRKSRKMNIVFGHWSTLGAYEAPGLHALDTGCLWGGSLTALRLDKGKPERIVYRCPEVRKPSLRKRKLLA